MNIVYFAHKEDVGVLKGEQKMKQRIEKWKLCCTSGSDIIV